jgi:hypothetical protein
MTDSSSIDNDMVSLAPTAASVLRINGPLRFRPHGSSQKAHVVLRRVDPESDSEGEGEAKGVVQFSLFAYKRIEVKPGKEILLTVAEGPFKDRAIIFEGHELEASSLSDVEEETQVAEDDDAFVPPEQSLPLKMRKPWAKRHEASVPLGACDVQFLSLRRHSFNRKAHVSPPGAPRHSVGVQTDLVDMTGDIVVTSAPAEASQTVSSTPARGGSLSSPSKPLGIPVSFASLDDSRIKMPPVTKVEATKMGATRPQHTERDHSQSPVKVDSTTDSLISPSAHKRPSISDTPAKQDDVSTNVCAHLRVGDPTTNGEKASTEAHVNDKLKRWSPSVPVSIALSATSLADETSESANSSGVTDDGNHPVLAPERPWSPSVPAALTTQASRRHNIRTHRVEQPENTNGTSETQPGNAPLSPSSPTPVPTTPLSPAKVSLPTKPRSSSFVPSGFGSDVTGQPPSSFSNEDNKVSYMTYNTIILTS